MFSRIASRSYASATSTHPRNVKGRATIFDAVIFSPSRNTDATVTMLGYEYRRTSAVETDVRLMALYHASEKRVPVMTANTVSAGRSLALILNAPLSSTMRIETSMTADASVPKRAIWFAVAPASIARTVNVPDVPHMTAANAIMPYARFLDIFMDALPAEGMPMSLMNLCSGWRSSGRHRNRGEMPITPLSAFDCTREERTRRTPG